jgi:hypothetical protein
MSDSFGTATRAPQQLIIIFKSTELNLNRCEGRVDPGETEEGLVKDCLSL